MIKVNMNKLYLVTGATGHLGSVLAKTLINKKCKVRALILSGEEKYLPENVEYVVGDVCDSDSLKPFFNRDGYDYVALVHCAGIVSISSKYNPSIWKVNVEGTVNVLDKALENGIDRVIYVSSVHALPELKYPELIVETKELSKDKVVGEYAKTKAEAARIALSYADKGLNVSVVHPSGIIGPGDIRHNNHSANSLKAMYEGKIPCVLPGGYDFVDVRDVVQGILQCIEYGKSNENYILSGHYLSVEDMLRISRGLKNKKASKFKAPLSLVKKIAPLVEWYTDNISKSKPLITPYSIYTLQSNARFSHVKASETFGYKVRDINETIRDTVIDREIDYETDDCI